jgi:hypothetical protein
MFGPRGGWTGVGGVNMTLSAKVAGVEGRYVEKTICEREGQGSLPAPPIESDRYDPG